MTMRSLLSLATFLLFGMAVGHAAGDEKPADTAKAAAMRKVLKKKIDVDFKDTRLEEALDEIKESAKGFRYRLDSKGGVSRNQSINFKAKGATIEAILDGMFKKNGLGYYVISNTKDPYDGTVWILQGKDRGYPLNKK
jgi:hypothetical protein